MFIIATLLLYLCAQTKLTDALTMEEEEIDSNKVMVKFYDLSDSQWSEKKEEFQKSVASYTSAFCEDNLDTCELANWRTAYEFASSDVRQAGESEADGSTLELYIYIQFNDALEDAVNDTTDTSYILVKAAVEQVLMDHRGDINEDAKVTITGVGNAEYAVEPNQRINTIMILVGFGVLLIFIGVWIGLYCWRNNQEKKAALKAGKLTCVVRKRSNKELKRMKNLERRTKQKESRSKNASAVSKSKVVPIVDADEYSVKYKDNTSSKSIPPEAAYQSPALAPSAVNHTQAPPLPDHSHPRQFAKRDKRVHITSNYFSEDREDVESGQRSLDANEDSRNRSLDANEDSKNRSLDSTADAAGATAVFQAHSIDVHNESIERKRKKHKRKKSKHSEDIETHAAVISMGAESEEKTGNLNDSRQETDSDNAHDMGRLGHRMT